MIDNQQLREYDIMKLNEMLDASLEITHLQITKKNNDPITTYSFKIHNTNLLFTSYSMEYQAITVDDYGDTKQWNVIRINHNEWKVEIKERTNEYSSRSLIIYYVNTIRNIVLSRSQIINIASYPQNVQFKASIIGRKWY